VSVCILGALALVLARCGQASCGSPCVHRRCADRRPAVGRARWRRRL